MAIEVIRRAPPRQGQGYMGIGNDGGIFLQGAGLTFHGSLPQYGAYTDVVGGDINSDGTYRVVRSGGAVYDFGCPHLGNGSFVNPCVGLYAAGGAGGYWLLDNSGAVDAFGLPYYGGLSQPGQVVTMIVRPQADGYWIFNSGGGFAGFGGAAGAGAFNTSGHSVMHGGEASPDGGGFIVNDVVGGVYAIGDVPFQGSFQSAGITPSTYIMSMCLTGDGGGYWITDANGAIFAFGNAEYLGAL